MHIQKVFGIGLPKTGTTSLTEALRILGFKAHHFPFFAINHASDKLSLKYSWIKKWDAFVDIPIPYFYKDLDRQFPDSKFILTIRDIEAWLGSCENSLVFPGTYIHNKPIRDWRYIRSILKLHHNLFGSVWFDRELFFQAYNYHMNNVRYYFKDRYEDLLVFDLCNENRWEKLCAFLDRSVPNKLFPVQNVGSKKVIKKNYLVFFWKIVSALHFGKIMPLEYHPRYRL